MWSRMLVAAGLATGLVTSTALAEEGYRDGRVFFIEPGVTVQRATETSAEEAQFNQPFLPGDRVWTDSAGRAEFQFPEGSVVRLDRRSKLDYSGHDEGQEERVVLRLWSGSTFLRVRTGNIRFEVETPAGVVRSLDRVVFRVDVDSGETRVSVYAGEAELDDGRGQVRLAAGERTFARWGAQAEEPRRFEPGEENDDFAQWDGQRESDERSTARSAQYLPDELDAYAGELDRNGQWQYESTVGNVWVPRVEFGWQPYSNGQWAWTPYGYTWVPNERWGWAPSHYGRWGQSASFGWYWVPGRTWGPGWVSWAVGGDYVGWCPLGWHDQPVRPWGHNGYAVSRGRYGQDPWNVVHRGDFASRNVGRRRVGVDRIASDELRAADSVALRPTRDARSLEAGGAAPRAVSRRQSPGDFVRELQVDNKTTIPAPWTHGYGPPPAGVDGARYGAQRRTDADDSKDARTSTPTSASSSGSDGRTSSSSQRQAQRTGYARRPAEDTSGAGQTAAPTASSAGAESRRSRSDWSTRSQQESSGGVGSSERTERSESSATGARSRSGNEGSSSYRRREEGDGGSRQSGGESSGASRSRSGGDGSGGSRQHTGAGASRPPRSDNGGSQPRSSGGGSNGSGGSRSGEHAAPRSHHN
jgi:hypothetical protein